METNKETRPKPLGMILDDVKTELTRKVAEIQQSYGLPASLLDFILTGILADVREMKCMEYRRLREEEEDGEHNDVSEQD